MRPLDRGDHLISEDANDRHCDRAEEQPRCCDGAKRCQHPRQRSAFLPPAIAQRQILRCIGQANAGHDKDHER
jgi:hypothetical protein